METWQTNWNTVREMLGDVSDNYSDSLIEMTYEMTKAEVEAYTNCVIPEYDDKKFSDVLMNICRRITVLKLLRSGTEGLASQSYSGVSESFIDGLPSDVVRVLNSKRKIRVI